MEVGRYGFDTPRSALGNTGRFKSWWVGGDLGGCPVIGGMLRARPVGCV